MGVGVWGGTLFHVLSGFKVPLSRNQPQTGYPYSNMVAGLFEGSGVEMCAWSIGFSGAVWGSGFRFRPAAQNPRR